MRRTARKLTAGLTVALLSSAVVGIGPVAAVELLPSVPTIEQVTPTPAVAFVPTTFKASVSYPQGTSYSPAGSLRIDETTSGTPVLVATVAFPGVPQQPVYVDVSGGFDIGTHTFTVTYLPTLSDVYAQTTSDPFTYVVDVATSETSLYAPAQVEAHHSFELDAPVGVPTNAGFGNGATVSFWRAGDASPICVVPATLANTMSCIVPAQPVGTGYFYAEYSGNAYASGSTSVLTPVVVVADVVHATGVGVSASVIYPYKDSYYDTVTIRGTREEPIKVGFKIYSPTNVLVKSGSYALATGSYAYAWTGRNSAGTILAEGKYRIVQTLWDAANTSRSVTSYVTLSKKYLHWHSSSITKLGTAVTSVGHSGYGTVTAYSGGYIRLSTPHVYSADWSGAGWEFSLPTGVSYRSISFRVYAKYVFTVGGGVRIGAQNFSTCAYSLSTTWYEGCFDSWHAINGTGVTAWSTTGSLTSIHRYGHAVRGAIANIGGTAYVYKAQVLFSYATLSY